MPRGRVLGGRGRGGDGRAGRRRVARSRRAARRGEPAALALPERSARYVAAAARNPADIIDLEVLVLTGSGFAIAGAIYLPVVQQELQRSAFPVPPFWGQLPSTMLD